MYRVNAHKMILSLAPSVSKHILLEHTVSYTSHYLSSVAKSAFPSQLYYLSLRSVAHSVETTP